MVEMANNNKAYKCNDLIEYLHTLEPIYICIYQWLLVIVQTWC